MERFSNADEYIQLLKEQLTSWYTCPFVNVAHDSLHVGRMLRRASHVIGVQGLQSQGKLEPDIHELLTAIWLHNLDRVQRIRGPRNDTEVRSALVDVALAAHDPKEERRPFVEEACRVMLEPSPFDEEARARIIDAVLNHSKKDDEEGDSHLMTALRILDKWDRFSVSGILGAGVANESWAFYDEGNPFGGYGDTGNEAQRHKDAWRVWPRTLEWWGMLPSDDARELVRPDFEKYLWVFRWFAQEIAQHTEASMDDAEADIEKALGKYYHAFDRVRP